MGIRFSKSIKIGNYLRLNLSKTGISATVGKRGASLTLGRRGAYVNVSPSVFGITGTGLSYRQKISGLPSFLKNKEKETADKNENLPESMKEQIDQKKPKTPSLSLSEKIEALKEEQYGTEKEPMKVSDARAVIDSYAENQEAQIHIHRYADPVMTEESFSYVLENLETEAQKELYGLSMEGDPDTVDSFITSFMNHLEIPYDVRVNYELSDHTLFADLDLPEIEDLSREYPVLKNYALAYQSKTQAELRNEYAETVMSLGVFLTASFFNLSPYIDTIVMSGFTTVRNKAGDLVDKYLYSVKFKRDVFEETDFSSLEDLYGFITGFENRINLSEGRSFREIKPYENEEKAVSGKEKALQETLTALRGLGFSESDVKRVLPLLEEGPEETTAELLKKGLNLLSGDSE